MKWTFVGVALLCLSVFAYAGLMEFVIVLSVRHKLHLGGVWHVSSVRGVEASRHRGNRFWLVVLWRWRVWWLVVLGFG